VLPLWLILLHNRFNDVAANYTPAKLNQWANAVYKDYKFDTADDFLAWSKK